METRLQSGARVAPAGDTARQFVIEHGPRGEPGPKPPITVWIEQTVKRTDYACSCSDRVHRVSASDVQKVIGMGYYQMKNGQRVKELKLPTYVCDCMGHFIE